MKLKTLILLLIIPVISIACDLMEGYSKFRPYASQSFEGWNFVREYIGRRNLSENFIIINDDDTDSMSMSSAPSYLQMEVDSLSWKIKEREGAILYYTVPYWKSEVYMKLDRNSRRALPVKKSYLGYIVDPFTGNSSVDCNINLFMDSLYNHKKSHKRQKMDLMVYFPGDIATDLFLQSNNAKKNLIRELFSDSTGYLTHDNITGVNFYFPEYRFDRSREMAQFVKTLSLVVDSLKNSKDEYIYGISTPHVKNLDLKLTFGYTEGISHYNYISGLLCFVDTVYFADFDEDGLPTKITVASSALDRSSIFTRMINPLYLIHSNVHSVDEEAMHDIDKLMDCDYSLGWWGLFLGIDIVLLLLFIVFIILLFTSTDIHLLKSRYPTLFVLIPITLITEILVFFCCFLEALSPQIIFETFSENYNYIFILIFLPIIPFSIYYLVQIKSKRDIIP